MPHAAVIKGYALFLHGGIPSKAKSLDEIAFAHITHPNSPTLTEILWNDPNTKPGFNHSIRNVGHTFGMNVAKQFLENNSIQILIRGHQFYSSGYKIHDNIVHTVFSCILPAYQNKRASLLHVEKNKIAVTYLDQDKNNDYIEYIYRFITQIMKDN
jgi:hypothetical protein